jgi:hypothetical protein
MDFHHGGMLYCGVPKLFDGRWVDDPSLSEDSALTWARDWRSLLPHSVGCCALATTPPAPALPSILPLPAGASASALAPPSRLRAAADTWTPSTSLASASCEYDELDFDTSGDYETLGSGPAPALHASSSSEVASSPSDTPALLDLAPGSVCGPPSLWSHLVLSNRWPCRCLWGSPLLRVLPLTSGPRLPSCSGVQGARGRPTGCLDLGRSTVDAVAGCSFFEFRGSRCDAVARRRVSLPRRQHYVQPGFPRLRVFRLRRRRPHRGVSLLYCR